MKTLFAYFILLIMIALQISFSNYLNITPNFFCLLVIYFSCQRGAIGGMFMGFLGGISLDIISYETLGFSALTGIIIGFIVGSLRKNIHHFTRVIPSFLGVFFLTLSSLV